VSTRGAFGTRALDWAHRTPSAALVAHLSFLAACGYGLSEVEQKVVGITDGTEGAA
jgi:hypothetical protein